MKRDLIVFGSARADVFLEVPSSDVQEFCSIDTKKCVIQLSYGSKIPLNKVTYEVGGNGANVAVGSTRLGVDSVLVAEVGNGPLADFTKRYLDKQIDTTHVTQTPGVGEGLGAVIMYGGERTILSYYPDHEPDFSGVKDSFEWAYLTSSGEKFESFYEEIYEFLISNSIRLAFNPGGRQLKKGREWMQKYLDITQVLLVNREEGEIIVGMQNQTFGREKELLSAIAQAGPKIVIVTDGANGSFVYDSVNSKYYRAGIMPIDAFERTGAGDAFSAASLSAIIKGKTLEEALTWGTLNSTSVIGHIGPEPGLLTEAKMKEWQEKGKEAGLKVEEF